MIRNDSLFAEPTPQKPSGKNGQSGADTGKKDRQLFH
jgi:hypothetical protein